MTDDQAPIEEPSPSELAAMLVESTAEKSLMSVLDEFSTIRRAVERFVEFDLDVFNSAEQVAQLRSLTERLAKHWVEGVKLTIEQLDFEGVAIAPELRAAAMRSIATIERLKLG